MNKLLECVQSRPNCLDDVITEDKTGAFEHVSEQKKEKMSISEVKSMLVVLFEADGIDHKEYVPPT